MWFCYLLCALPIVGGLWAWLCSRKIVWWEWLLPCATCVISCAIWHFCLVWGMTTDQETWSGYVTRATHHPQWVEEYEVAIYRTVVKTRLDDDGDLETYTEEEFSHYETRHRTHPQHWTANDSLGQEFNIEQPKFKEAAKAFGGAKPQHGHKPGFVSGDKNIYVATTASAIFPTTTIKSWTNRVKSAPSLFSYAKMPPDLKTFEYPFSRGWCASGRLLGSASKKVPILEWDRLNARLGSTKKVNLIACGFPTEGDGDSCMAQYQEAAWVGGKKNDLVICFGGGPEKPTWVSVFGWTEKEDCKRNIESLVLQKGFVKDVLPEIEKEVVANYQIKDWSKFDYLEIEPGFLAYVIILVVFLVTQGGIWWFAFTNEEEKSSEASPVY